jgi:serine/threonine protein kinase, bacterial
MPLHRETVAHPHRLNLLFAAVASATLAGCWWGGDSGTNAAPPVAAAPAPAPAPTPAPPPATFTLGGGITGLTASGLVLAAGIDTLTVASAATGFTMPTALAEGASYAVSVQAQPTGQACSVSNGSGTISGANVTNVAVACAALAHSLGGTISGLASPGLALRNGSDTVTPAAGALSFTFPTQVAEGGGYAVGIGAQPTGETCSLAGATGTMGTSDLSSVQVTCAANAYHLSGTIAGLTATGLILANGSDTVSPAANATSFAFAQPVAFGGSYSLTVQQQPTGQTCVATGTYPATMGAGDVTNLAVSCTTATALPLLAGRETCPVYPAPQDVDGTGAAASTDAITRGVAFDAAGNLYFTTGHLLLRKITPAGVVTTIAGQYYNGGNLPPSVDGTGSSASFSSPGSLALDSAGNIYVMDGPEIRKVTQAGVVTTLAGSTTTGYVDGTGSAAQFSVQLGGVAVDTAGNLFVGDVFNNVVRKITPAGVVSTFAGSGSYGHNDGTGTAASFIYPYGLVFDAAGNLFVTDLGNNLIRKITPAGVVTTVAGSTAGGFADGTGSAALFGQPKDLSIDAAGNLFTADNNRSAIREITPAGVVTTVAVATFFTSQTGQQPPAGAAQLPVSNSSEYYAVDSAGKLYVPFGCAMEILGGP